MNVLRRLRPAIEPCVDVPATIPTALATACQECGSRSSLRLCATCGHVGCCESQRGDARTHALAEGHPVIYSIPAPDGFAWCYTHDTYVG